MSRVEAEIGFTRAIREAVNALNAAINGAADLGLRVEIEVVETQEIQQPWPVPHVVSTVTKEIE